MDEWEQQEAERAREEAEREAEAAARQAEAEAREKQQKCDEATARLNGAADRIRVLEEEQSRLHSVRRERQGAKDQLDISFETASAEAGRAQTEADAAASALRQAETDLANAERSVTEAEAAHEANTSSFSPTGFTWPVTQEAASNARGTRDHLRDTVVPSARSRASNAATRVTKVDADLQTIATERESLRNSLVTIGNEIQRIGEQLTPERETYGNARNDVERYCGDGW